MRAVALDIERVFAEHAGPLYGFLVYRVGDPTVAEDLLGDTFERAVRSRRRYDASKGAEQTWLYAIAVNCLRDHLRRANAEGRALDRLGHDGGSNADTAGRVEGRDQLLRHLTALDPREREVVSLRYGADLRVEEIAKITGKRVTTVRGRLYRGLEHLRVALEEEESAFRRPSPEAR